ncbi:MAG TPA: hypothetical protein VFN26_12605 [Candidatus Acidoferrum sp.]|nr:hypothetical protein [Candidatus Acidoferrum sp.]
MDHQITTAGPANGASAPHELFALTDEQILEIEPEAAEAPLVEQPLLAVPDRRPEAASTKSATDPNSIATSPRSIENMQQSAQARVPVPREPPPWLAAQMKDPWNGEEAKELWNGVQQAKQEAAAYREAIATPEEARALKELYPGGVNEARATAERARTLEDIDRAYFGAAGTSAEETSASRAQLAAMMLREDPAAFREMVFAGLRALEEGEKGIGGTANATNLPRLAQVFAANHGEAQASVGATLVSRAEPRDGSPAASGGMASTGGASPAPTTATGGRQGDASIANHEAQVAAYAAFEKSANEDLERSVGGTIERTLEQALPAATGTDNGALKGRLSGAIRQDVEAALKADRQLGEQIAQILSARRFDSETRAQVVRLIDERARQLVPSAAKRVLNEWTHTTMAAHRSNASRADAASTRREVAPVYPGGASFAASSSANVPPGKSLDPNRGATRSRAVDYRKLSDEQILEL